MQEEITAYFLGYSTNSHVFHVFNKRTGVAMESVNVTVENVEQFKSDTKKFIDIKDEETVKTIEPHYDGHTSNNNTSGIYDSDETKPKIVKKSKKLESRALKNILLLPSLEVLLKEEGQEERRLLTNGRWLE